MGRPLTSEGGSGEDEQTTEEPAPPRKGQHSHSRRARPTRWWLWGTLATVVVIAVAAAVVVGVRLATPLPQVGVVLDRPTSLVVPGVPQALPWPHEGQAAVFVPALGLDQRSGEEAPIPAASLTKLVTALVILRDHPLPASAQGPDIPITAADVAEFGQQEVLGQSTVPIAVGEVLTERQALEALVIRSANDVAYALAVWDAGSEAAFVAKMNVAAHDLGALQSHFVDASGYEPGSVSTASDVLKVAAADMAIPAFAEVAGMATATLPDVGVVHNIVPEVGGNGVVGVKSGYTSQAGGCVVLASDDLVAGRPVLVLVAVLGQDVTDPIPTPPPPASPLEPLPRAYHVGDQLLAVARASVVAAPVTTRGQVVGHLLAPWQSGGGIPLVMERSVVVPGWVGQKIRTWFTIVRPAPPVVHGDAVGAVHALVVGGVRPAGASVGAVVAGSSLVGPSLSWRLTHG